MSALLSINNYHYRRGGADVVFLEHNRLFEDAGWQVVPFAMQHAQNLPTPWSQYFADELEFGSGYSALEQLQRVPRVIYSRDARLALSRLLDAQRFSVAHAHNIYHHLSPSILPLLRQRGVPVFMTLHDLKLACPAYTMRANGRPCEQCKPHRVYNAVRNRCIKGSLALSALIALESAVHRVLDIYGSNVHRFVAPSQFLIDKLVEWGWQRERFVYVPNFVTTGDLVRAPVATPLFAYVGRLSAEKGVATLIRAASMAGADLLVAGTGPDEAALHELATGLSARVTFVGFRSGAALQEIYDAASVIVVPSECYENAPLAVLEAYAAGKPVIGAAIGGIPELVHVGQTGMTFVSGDVESLAAVLVRYRQLPAPAVAEQGRAARAWVQTDFSPQVYRERIEQLYASASQSNP